MDVLPILGGGRRRTAAPTGRRRVGLLAGAALLLAYHRFVRPWHLDWGATDAEVERRLPGDDLVSDASGETTRAVTIRAPSDEVWPWIVQLGQGRGGFYSYSWLENLIGADVHNADRIVTELQDLAEGDAIRLVRADYPLRSPITSMTVVRLDPGRTLVLRGYDGGTWTFHLDPVDAETTRFVVRGRAPADPSLVTRVLRYALYEVPHFVMERGTLLGVRARAEGGGRAER